MANKKTVVCITNAESYLGFNIARHVLREVNHVSEQGKGDRIVRVATRNPQDAQKLSELGAEVIQIDHNNAETLKHAFHNCTHIIMIPENSPDRLVKAEAIINSLEYENVHHVLLLSQAGCTAADEASSEYLAEYREIENMLESKKQNAEWCIFRVDFLQQFVYMFLPYIVSKGVLPLSIGQNGKFAPINLKDVARASWEIVSGEVDFNYVTKAVYQATPLDTTNHPQVQRQEWGDSMSKTFSTQPMNTGRHHKQIYTLDGPSLMTGYEVASKIDQVLGPQKSVKFKAVSRQEMKEYLLDLRQYASLQRIHEQGEEKEVQLDKSQPSKYEKGIGFAKPSTDFLTDTAIETMLDYFDWIASGRGASISHDTRKLIDREPERFDEYLMSHAQDIKAFWSA